MLTEHFVCYLPPTRETLSDQNPQEQELTEFMAWCGEITSAPSTALIVPSADISDALKVAVFTSSAPSVKKHSQSSHAKMRKNLLQCPKDPIPVKYIHLTPAAWVVELESSKGV